MTPVKAGPGSVSNTRVTCKYPLKFSGLDTSSSIKKAAGSTGSGVPVASGAYVASGSTYLRMIIGHREDPPLYFLESLYTSWLFLSAAQTRLTSLSSSPAGPWKTNCRPGNLPWSGCKAPYASGA